MEVFPDVDTEGQLCSPDSPVSLDTSRSQTGMSMLCAGLLVIPTFQRSKNDLVKMGETIETEKDLLLEKVSQGKKPSHRHVMCILLDLNIARA